MVSFNSNSFHKFLRPLFVELEDVATARTCVRVLVFEYSRVQFNDVESLTTYHIVKTKIFHVTFNIFDFWQQLERLEDPYD